MYLLDKLYLILQQVPNSNLLIALALLDVQAVIIGYALGFSMRAAFLIGKNIFNAVEVHPLLPAALALVIAWTLAIVELLQSSSILVPVHMMLTLSGAGIVTILAAMAWHHYPEHLRHHHPHRTAPDPDRSDRAGLRLAEPAATWRPG